MSEFEFHNIDKCIELIGEKLNFSKDHQWRQHDYELLIEEIYSATKTQISLSTIKRIWNHSNNYIPRISTLDAIAQYLGFKSWSYFSISANNQIKVAKANKERSGTKFYFPMMLVLMAVLLVYFVLDRNSSKKTEPKIDIEKINFSHNKTVKIGVPTSVIFHYDLNDFQTDEAYIQLSWNKRERFPIKSNGFIRTLMYYYPGWHEAKLIIGDSIIKRDYVSINTDGWVSLFRERGDDVVPIYLDADLSRHDGVLYSSPDVLSLAKADTSLSNYYVSHFNVQDFGVNADNFSFETRMKNPSEYGKFSCHFSSIYIYTEHSGIFLSLGAIGCSSQLGLSVSEKYVSGSDQDLSGIAADYFQWQDVKVVIEDKVFKLYMNGELACQLEYEKALGDIKAWHYYFNGSGAVDYLRIFDGTGQQKFTDDFD